MHLRPSVQQLDASQRPDHNPVEMLWRDLKWAVHKKCPQASVNWSNVIKQSWLKFFRRYVRGWKKSYSKCGFFSHLVFVWFSSWTKRQHIEINNNMQNKCSGLSVSFFNQFTKWTLEKFKLHSLTVWNGAQESNSMGRWTRTFISMLFLSSSS